MSLITFTSNFGSGGEMIAQKVAEELGIKYYNDQKLHDRALAMGVTSKDLEGLDEKAPRFFDRLFTNKPALYLDILGSVVYDIAAEGEGVLIGHGAQVFLEDFNCALHVMVQAPEETRRDWLSKQQNISEKAALQLVHKMDRRMHDYIQFVFGRDWQDFSGYDVVINLEKIGAAWATKLIVDLAGSDEVKSCSLKAIEEMKLSSLKRKVDAAIIKSNLSHTFTSMTVEVTGEGQVHLRGLVSNKEDLNKMLRIVKEVPGVTDVTSEIIVMSAASGY